MADDDDRLDKSKVDYLRQPEMYNEILKHQQSHDIVAGNLKIRTVVYDDKAPVMEVYCTYYDPDTKEWCGWWEHFVNGEVV